VLELVVPPDVVLLSGFWRQVQRPESKYQPLGQLDAETLKHPCDEAVLQEHELLSK